MWHMPRAAAHLASLHLALLDCVPDGAPHPAWVRGGLDHLDAMLARWTPQRELTAALLADARQRLAERYFSEALLALPRTIVHGGYGARHLLWQGETVSGVLHFERAHGAAAISDFGRGVGSHYPPLLHLAVATYDRVRPLSSSERDLLPEALLHGALCELDDQLTVYHDAAAAERQAQVVVGMLQGVDALRRAVALR
jgi:Ser/Thr protein kinase RdoA (MazF antagonist)